MERYYNVYQRTNNGTQKISESYTTDDYARMMARFHQNSGRLKLVYRIKVTFHSHRLVHTPFQQLLETLWRMS